MKFFCKCVLSRTLKNKKKEGKTREWTKRKSESGYLQNIFQELKTEDQMGFKDMFRVSVTAL